MKKHYRQSLALLLVVVSSILAIVFDELIPWIMYILLFWSFKLSSIDKEKIVLDAVEKAMKTVDDIKTKYL